MPHHQQALQPAASSGAGAHLQSTCLWIVDEVLPTPAGGLQELADPGLSFAATKQILVDS
jgi:hypothetical protein